MSYVVMVNYWNGKPGLASEDETEEYSGVRHNTKAGAEAEAKTARYDTRMDPYVNYVFIKEAL